MAETVPAKRQRIWSTAGRGFMLQDGAGGWFYHGELVDVAKPKVKGLVGCPIDSIWYGSELFGTRPSLSK